MNPNHSPLRVLLALAACSGPALGEPLPPDTPGPGLVLTDSYAPPTAHDPFGLGFDVFGVVAQVSEWREVTFDGRRVELRTPQGLVLDVLLTLPNPTFPAFARVEPGTSFVLVGESSQGNVYRVALDGSGAVSLGSFGLPYDADFEDASSAIVSAATCFGCGTQLTRVELATGVRTTLATVSGPTGPVAVDAAGDLFYGLFSTQSSGPPSVVRFAAALLDGARVLGETDAELVASAPHGVSALVADPWGGGVLLAENDASSGTGAIVRIGGSDPGAVLVSGQPQRWIADLQLLPGSGPGVFHPFQPKTGGLLAYTSTNFGTADIARRLARPERPALSFDGPGTEGIGAVTLAVRGAPGLGLGVVVYGPSSSWAAEAALPLPGLPWVTGLALGDLQVAGSLLEFDAAGDAQLGFTNFIGLTDWVAAQALCTTPGGSIVGLSSHDTL